MNLLGDMLLAACIYVSLTASAAQADDSIQRYSFELHCTKPLLGSRWQQPEHEVNRMFASLEEFREAHPHEGVLDARLFKIWRDGDFQKQDFHHRAFLTLVVEDEALHAAAQDWIRSLAGIQPDSIKPEQCDPADPFAEWPPVDFIFNGTSYHYPGDFSPLEREWAAAFAQTNYPNQALFIVHPDERSTGRFGLGELSRADTFGEGQAIVINTLQEKFDIGELESPAGMDFHPRFLPTHLVPQSDEELREYLLGQLRMELQSFTGENMYGSDYWLQLDYPLAGNAWELSAMAGSEFMDWLAGYPEFSEGARFGDCTMEIMWDADKMPLQLSFRLNHMGLADRYELQDRLAGLGLQQSMQFGNHPPAVMASGDLEQSAEYGYLFRNADNSSVDSTVLQQLVDDYLDHRADILPTLSGAQLSVDAKEQPSGEQLTRLKASMPSMTELQRMQSWMAWKYPELPRWQLDYDNWHGEEAVTGFVDINGIRYQYPEDFAGVEARQLDNQLRYNSGQRMLAILEGIDYKPLEDPALESRFGFGDLALVECKAEGLSVTTLEQDWQHGVDIGSLDIPAGFSPSLMCNLPYWYGDDPQEIREFARAALAGYKVQIHDEQSTRERVSYRQIIANPIPGTQQQMGSLVATGERLSAEQKQATLVATRLSYEALLQWLDESPGYSREDLEFGYIGMSKGSRVSFNANEFGGFVQQIQIGVADATDEQLVDIMNHIHLATGMRDIWASGNLFPSLLLDDPEIVNSAARPMTLTTGSR